MVRNDNDSRWNLLLLITKAEIAKNIRSKKIAHLASDGWAEPTIQFTPSEPVAIPFPDVWQCKYELIYRVELTIPKYRDKWKQAHNSAVQQIHTELYGEIIGRLAQIIAMVKYSPKAEIETLLDNLLDDLKDER